MASHEEALNRVNPYSRPSRLKITDLRLARVRVGGYLLKLETNQGIYGLGEVRDGASKAYALVLKRLLVGENPCNVDKVFRAIRQFGHHGRQGGGVSGVEMALMDLAGKAYGVPCYQLSGGRFRDRVRIYADTPSVPDPEEMGRILRDRAARGFTFLKMDVGIDLLQGVPGALCAPSGHVGNPHLMHPFTGIRLTERGLAALSAYVARVREIVGGEIPLAADHFGHLGVEDGIRLARALDPYHLAWLEDMIPWQFTDQYVRLSQSCATPICTGEDIYGRDGFRPLLEARAIAVCHPDLATAGGILETKRIGDLAQEHGVSMAMHLAATPVATMASVHCAAATENFLALEHHFADLPWWDDLVTGIPKPIVRDGAITVPEGPGLGIDLDEEAVRAHLHPRDPICFPPTGEWDDDASHDRLWS